MEIKWAETWAAESKKKKLWVFAPTPSIKVLQLNKGIKKLESALITQMRTGKISLFAFLYDWKWVNNSQFECGHRASIVWNNLWEYRKLTCLKRETWRDQKRKEPFGIVEWRKMLTHPSYPKKVVYSMMKTRLLKQVQGTAMAKPWQTALYSEGLSFYIIFINRW